MRAGWNVSFLANSRPSASNFKSFSQSLETFFFSQWVRKLLLTKYHFLLVSPDGQWILGQAPELQNYFVAAAMRSIGAGAAGGIGEAIANHIVEGRPPFDMYNLVSTFLKNM